MVDKKVVALGLASLFGSVGAAQVAVTQPSAHTDSASTAGRKTPQEMQANIAKAWKAVTGSEKVDFNALKSAGGVGGVVMPDDDSSYEATGPRNDVNIFPGLLNVYSAHAASASFAHVLHGTLVPASRETEADLRARPGLEAFVGHLYGAPDRMRLVNDGRVGGYIDINLDTGASRLSVAPDLTVRGLLAAGHLTDSSFAGLQIGNVRIAGETKFQNVSFERTRIQSMEIDSNAENINLAGAEISRLDMRGNYAQFINMHGLKAGGVEINGGIVGSTLTNLKVDNFRMFSGSILNSILAGNMRWEDFESYDETGRRQPMSTTSSIVMLQGMDNKLKEALKPGGNITDIDGVIARLGQFNDDGGTPIVGPDARTTREFAGLALRGAVDGLAMDSVQSQKLEKAVAAFDRQLPGFQDSLTPEAKNPFTPSTGPGMGL